MFAFARAATCAASEKPVAVKVKDPVTNREKRWRPTGTTADVGACFATVDRGVLKCVLCQRNDARNRRQTQAAAICPRCPVDAWYMSQVVKVEGGTHFMVQRDSRILILDQDQQRGLSLGGDDSLDDGDDGMWTFEDGLTAEVERARGEEHVTVIFLGMAHTPQQEAEAAEAASRTHTGLPAQRPEFDAVPFRFGVGGDATTLYDNTS